MLHFARISFFCKKLMKYSLPLVRPFEEPYSFYKQRDATQEEMLESLRAGNGMRRKVDVELIRCVTNAYEAAEHLAMEWDDSRLEFRTDDFLNASPDYQSWLKAMPNPTPAALVEYQTSYPIDDFGAVGFEINACGTALSMGQELYHGGIIPFDGHGSFTTSRPLSTTLCPQIALRLADWGGKGYHAGEVCIYVLHIRTPNSNAFVFDNVKSEKGHEKEVLIAAGARMVQQSKTLIRFDYPVATAVGHRTENKRVPVYVCEVEVFS